MATRNKYAVISQTPDGDFVVWATYATMAEAHRAASLIGWREGANCWVERW